MIYINLDIIYIRLFWFTLPSLHAQWQLFQKAGDNMAKNLRRIFKRITVFIVLLFALLFFTVLILLFIYKEKIAADIKTAVETDYGVSVTSKDLKTSITDHWPNISIQFKELVVTNKNNNPNALPIFKAQIVSLSFNALRLLKKEFIITEISIKNGGVTLAKDVNGNTNFAFKPENIEKKKNKSPLFEIKKINLANVTFNFYNRQKNKHIGLDFKKNTLRLNWFGKNISASLNGELAVNELLFNSSKGPFLKDAQTETNLNFIYLNSQKKIYIEKTSSTIIENQKYNLEGIVFLDTAQKLFIRIKADIVNVEKSLKLLSTKIQQNLSLIHVTNGVKLDALILTKLGKGESPLLNISFAGKNNNVTIGRIKVPYTNVSYNAKLVCSVDSSNVPNMAKATLTIKDINGKIYDVPFTANIKLVNLENPYIFINSNLRIQAKDIKFKPGKDFDLGGFCNANIKYEGPATNLKAETFLKHPMKLRGQLNFEKLQYCSKSYKVPFTINGKALLLNDSIQFNNLSLTTVGGNCNISGNANGFTSYVCNIADGFKANINIKTDFFNLNPLLHKPIKAKKIATSTSIAKIKNSNFEFKILLDAKKLLIKKMQAENAFADLYYFNDNITLKKVNLNTCKGTLSASGVLNNYSNVKAEIELKNVDVNQLFIQCENFGQETVKSENILGILTAKTNINADFDEQFKLLPGTLNSQVTAELKNGHLVNFESLQKISRYVFRKRNFMDISFSAINPKFSISNDKVLLEDLEIASNVLNFFVGGLYSFKGQSNLNIVIPWNNLKIRGKNYVTRKHEKDTTSRGLKLNIYGNPGNLKIKLGNKRDSTLILDEAN